MGGWLGGWLGGWVGGWLGGWSDSDYKAISVPIGIELELIGTELGKIIRNYPELCIYYIT